MSFLRGVVGLMAAGALGLGCTNTLPSCNCVEAPRGCVYTGRADCPCASMVCSDIGPLVDVGNAVADVGAELGRDVGTDAGADGGADAGTDLGRDASGDANSGTDAGTDAPTDLGAVDVGFDAGHPDAGSDAGTPDADVGTVSTDRGAADVATDRGVVEVDAVVVRDVPTADVPTADVPTADVPTADVPRADVPSRLCPVAPADRACVTDSQCVVGIYTQNCVGEARAVGYNARALEEFRMLNACWVLAVAEMVRCSDRPSRGIELEQTGTFVTNPTTVSATCRAGQCVAITH